MVDTPSHQLFLVRELGIGRTTVEDGSRFTTASVGDVQTWPVIVLAAFSLALSIKASLVAEIHGVHIGTAHSATLHMAPM